jgi:hypothetical protein
MSKLIRPANTALPLILLATLLVVGCNSPGSKYLGKWENIKNSHDQIEIVSNGDNFLIKQASSGFLNNKPETTTVTAVLKDGVLQIQGGFLTTSLTYVKATDTLITPGMLGGNVEYRRRK